MLVGTSNPEVRINISPEIELHEKKNEPVASPPQEQADNTAAEGNGSTEEKDENRKSPPPRDLANDQSINEDLIKKLYKAALEDDWKTAYVEVFQRDRLKNSRYLTARITANKDTALHIAVVAESSIFAKMLVKYMEKDDLAIKNSDGDTAFFLVAARGMVELAKVMYEKNKELLGIRGGGEKEMLPIHIAAQSGHEKMVRFLYRVTKPLTEEDKKQLKALDHGKKFLDEEIIRKAALKNEWSIACPDILKANATTSLTDNGDSALHIAAAAGSYKFIDSLLRYMNEGDLKTTNGDGNTAFYLAAKSGRLKCVKLMLQAQKDTKLPSIGGADNLLPIQIAAQLGHKTTVKCLYYEYYNHKKDELGEKDCKKLLPNLICRAELLDVAWDLVKKQPNLATVNLSNGTERMETFLHVVARTHLMSPELSIQNQANFFKRFFNKFYNRNKCPHEKLPQKVLNLLRHILKKEECREDWMHEVIFEAVNHENVEFLSLIICENSKLMIPNVTRRGKTAGLIFANAILRRQEDIFNLRKRLPRYHKAQTLKQIRDYKDHDGNNILHLAGKLGPLEKLDAISGVNLHLQQELMWFEGVSNMVDASKAYEKNRNGMTPKVLFEIEHKQLKEMSEQGMKYTANSCMIVAALIATVVFAAAFTVPGGTNESVLPRFANELSFRIFVLADAISLVLSVYSLLIFLAINTSRYAEKDFLLELPKKLVVGLLTLLLSIAVMMMVFCTTIFIVFKVENIWVRILLSVSASLPVIHFAKMKGRLLFDVARSNSEINSILKEGKRKKGTYRVLEMNMGVE